LMKKNMNSFEPDRQPVAWLGRIRKSVLILTTILALVAVALVMVASKGGRPQGHSAESTAEGGQTPESVGASRDASEPASPNSSTVRVQSPRARRPIATPSEPGTSDHARQLVRSLSEVNLQPGELTPEIAEQWQRHLVELNQQGTAAVPVLQEFFRRNEDVRFDSGSDTNLLGEPTLRIAFIKVLFDLPAPENVELQEQVLRTTTDPDEIALLANQLELQERGKYRDAIIEAAKAALEQARNGRLPGRDASPLVELLKDYEAAGEK
jgi:hypothetical protein